MTDSDGHYELRIVRAGQYYLGTNLNHTPTQDTPYPRWFYPGTEDPVSATSIDFSGRPEVRTPRAVVTVFDSSQAIVAQAFADQNGRLALHVFAGAPYRLLVVWPGNTPEDAVSAAPLDIQPDSSPLSLRLTLTQPGNSFFEEHRQGIGSRR